MSNETKPRRIAVILHSRAEGGLEGLALRLAADWAAAADVSVITIAETSYPQAMPSGVEEHCLAHPAPAASGIARLFALWRTAQKLRSLLVQHAPDVIVSHGDRTNALALFAARKLPGRRILVEHNDFRHHEIGRFWSALRALTYPIAHRVIGVSAGVIAGLPEPWQMKGRAIPNPVPRLVAPPDRAADPNLIVAMGRLTWQKGFDLLIEAFAMLAPRYPALRLVIHGEGEARGALQAHIERLSLAGRVSLPGRAANPALALSQGAIFAFPSRYEGFGLALGEAMGLGLAVVAADCESGPREMIRDGENGLLVPPGDAEALAGAITQLLDDPALAQRLGAAARALPDEFSAARWLAAWRQEVGLAGP